MNENTPRRSYKSILFAEKSSTEETKDFIKSKAEDLAAYMAELQTDPDIALAHEIWKAAIKKIPAARRAIEREEKRAQREKERKIAQQEKARQKEIDKHNNEVQKKVQKLKSALIKQGFDDLTIDVLVAELIKKENNLFEYQNKKIGLYEQVETRYKNKTYFIAPYGRLNEDVRKILDNLGMSRNDFITAFGVKSKINTNF